MTYVMCLHHGRFAQDRLSAGHQGPRSRSRAAATHERALGNWPVTGGGGHRLTARLRHRHWPTSRLLWSSRQQRRSLFAGLRLPWKFRADPRVTYGVCMPRSAMFCHKSFCRSVPPSFLAECWLWQCAYVQRQTLNYVIVHELLEQRVKDRAYSTSCA